mmetsp:Transcript_83735/g.163978  ORF Transcript_83735/g.163978 Transcript_83735/m.163978 type:complete len:205 (+) Transcript_83735:230-844(+)
MHFDCLLTSEPLLRMKPRLSFLQSPDVLMPLSSHLFTVRCVHISLPGFPGTSMHLFVNPFVMNPDGESCHLSTYWPWSFASPCLHSPRTTSGVLIEPGSSFSTAQSPLFLLRSLWPVNSHWCQVPGLSCSHSPRYRRLPAPGAKPGGAGFTFMHMPLILLTRRPASVKCHTWSVNGHSYIFISSSMHLPVLRFLKKPSGVWSHF